MRAITLDGNIVVEAKDITDASTTSENTITITITMRGRLGVTFQGRGFESHSRDILQFYFSAQARQNRAKGFRLWNHESRLLSNGKTFDFGSRGLGFDFHGLRSYNFWFSYLLFAFRREVDHLTSPGLDHLGRSGSIRIHNLFHHLVSPDEKKMLLRQFFQRELFLTTELFLIH